MSRGPGWIEQALIKIFFHAKLNNAYTTEELCERIFKTDKVEKAHRVALLRAGSRLRLRDGYEDLHPCPGGHLGRTIVWYNRANVMSYAMARLKAGSYFNYRNRDPRRDWLQTATEKTLRNELRPGGR